MHAVGMLQFWKNPLKGLIAWVGQPPRVCASHVKHVAKCLTYLKMSRF